MGEAELKSQIEVVIDASIVSSHESHGHSFVVDVANQPLQSSILTRLHAGYFRISLALGAQALLWKITIEHANESQAALRHVSHMLPSTAFLLLWCLALLVLITLSPLYILRCFFYFHMVKAEFLHHIGVNFLYAPWISWLLMLQSAPFISPENLTYRVLWLVFAVPVMVLDVKIYGQWFTTEKRFLSMMANPTSHMSVLGNLVGARAAAQMGWKEIAVFMFSLGMIHYLVLFVTLYQRQYDCKRFPVMLRPAFFLFVAAPSMASLAWSSISGAFDTSSKLLFFLSLFLWYVIFFFPSFINYHLDFNNFCY